MVSAISHATQPQPVAQTTATSTRKSSPTPSGPSTDTVELSKTAQAMLAAMQEATETPAQTAKEASHGDVQAQQLLAKEAAAKPVTKK